MIPQIIGWTGTAFLFAGLYGIGNQQRGAFLFSIVGEALWIAKGIYTGMWDLVVICVVFLLMAARSYALWAPADKKKAVSPCCPTQPRRYPEQRCKVCDCPAPGECDLSFGGNMF